MGDDDSGPKASEALATLSELETYSLVARSAEEPAFTVHRLVQDVTRHREERGQNGREPPGALLEALKWVNAAFTGDPQDMRTWPTLDPLTPHALAVADHADRAGVPGPTVRLLNQLGLLFLKKARHREAEPLMRRALVIGEDGFGHRHPKVAICLNNLAQLLHETNRLDEAEPLMRRALEIFLDFTHRTGHEHPHLQTVIGSYRLLLQALGKEEEIEATLEALRNRTAQPD